MDTKPWTKDRLLSLITNKVEEHSGLEYKAAGALDGTDKKKSEITKDVSAFANSAGGTLIYGLKEFDDPALAHLPQALDPIKPADFSKERLDQIIQLIRPKIDGVNIISVPADDSGGSVCYVVEIPQSSTAHQAKDYRYYKRRNFLSEPMEDYEIRDVMMRQRHPVIEVDFYLRKSGHNCGLQIVVANRGSVVAHHVCVYVRIPEFLHVDTSAKDDFQLTMEGGEMFFEAYLQNVHKDLIGVKPGMPRISMPGGGDFGGFPDEKFYSSRYDPILPKMTMQFAYGLGIDFANARKDDEFVTWEIFADNAPARSGKTFLTAIELA